MTTPTTPATKKQYSAPVVKTHYSTNSVLLLCVTPTPADCYGDGSCCATSVNVCPDVCP
jgi:hypothetical protein